MLIAVAATLLFVDYRFDGQGWSSWRPGNMVGIAIALALGTLVGAVLARRIQMTAMPQLVAVFNGLGGLASAFVALGDVAHVTPASSILAGAAAFGVLVGGLTFTGSLIAFGKLQGSSWAPSRPVTFPWQKTLNAGLLALSLLFVCLFAGDPQGWAWMALVVPLSLVLGVLAVLPIGGADMPVVVALLNSYSGVAAAAAGFAVGNEVLVVAGALVGASGIILTLIMCRAMNRSVANVLFGAFGTGDGGAAPTAPGGGPARTVRNYTPEDGAILLGNARSVIIVPGYGLAVAQAQHTVQELATEIQKRGGTVRYAIHPVAGRMPGHMNVLLAEANVPYDQLLDLEQVNPYFESCDVALVVGANDVVNPAARTDKTSPIYGMPILDADKAQNVIVMKRSLGSGFAGIDNEIFFLDKTMMLFGDAKKTLMGLVSEVKRL
jgi:NAD(P) transhydrogenase subunit beta